jgi:hypothetical protein
MYEDRMQRVFLLWDLIFGLKFGVEARLLFSSIHYFDSSASCMCYDGAVHVKTSHYHWEHSFA